MPPVGAGAIIRWQLDRADFLRTQIIIEDFIVVQKPEVYFIPSHNAASNKPKLAVLPGRECVAPSTRLR